ncbi:serine/threonine protein kinase [Roseateles cellulosilyticus]|uniref:Serine/threonine protein kinase n=1 Tax=Pelomonas cellulosilytica TaxID=2906762 RepID=A0ABS8XX95_9BURK|nr:serine/threonine-protein kinase [Pelomonas sp. P8]MCE4557282.1 serine/threonine protein kinase [Pelomonas sp. P8]
MTAVPPDAADHALLALPSGTRFGELEILGTLGVGGFGIVYLAVDHSLEREIAIKEYMPSQFAQRDGQSQVSVRSISMRETFELGRRSFVNEARLLARFDHPSLLKVYRFWEANGTAYMAMPRLVGQNLREARNTQATPPPEAWTRRIFDAVLSGLEALHAQQVWHRDVAPDNIFLPADGGSPILLDFGAARQAISDRTQVFTAILKPSFAPIEQYAEADGLKQGPWTDFYALAAVMHELLIGRPPPPCTARAMADELTPLAIEGYSPTFLAALDWALRVPPHQRPQNAAAWRDAIEGRATVPPARGASRRSRRPPPPPPPPPPPEKLDIEFADTVQIAPEELPGRMAGATASRRPGVVWLVAAAVLGVALVALVIAQWRHNVARNAQAAEAAAIAASAAAAAEAASAASAAELAASAARVEPVPLEPEPAASESAGAVVSLAASQPAKPLPTAVSGTGAGRASTARRGDTAARSASAEKAGESHPVPRSPVYAAPEPVAAAPVAQAEPAPMPAAVEHRTASEACGGRVLLARAWCIDRQCEKPVFRNDPECVKLREIREQRSSLR